MPDFDRGFAMGTMTSGLDDAFVMWKPSDHDIQKAADYQTQYEDKNKKEVF